MTDPKRDAKIVKLYTKDGLTQSAIASRFGIAQKVVSQVITKAREAKA